MNKEYLLKIDSFLAIKKLDVPLTPGVHGFAGNNGVGKSTLISAIHNILTGSHDIRTINNESKRSEIRLEEYNDGELSKYVAKIQTEKTSRYDAKGLPPGQTTGSYLSSLFDREAINPINLMGKDPVKYLQQHLEIKARPEDLIERSTEFDINANAFDECQKQAKYIEVVRREKGREVEHAKALLEEAKRGVTQEFKEPEESRDTILGRISVENARLDKAESVVKERENLQDKLIGATKRLDDLMQEFKDNETNHVGLTDKYDQVEKTLALELEQLKRKFDEDCEKARSLAHQKRGDIIASKKRIEGANTEISKAIEHGKSIISELNETINNTPPVDVTAAQLVISQETAKLKEHDAYDEFLRNKSHIETRATELAKHESEYTTLDARYDHYARKLPKALLERCELPVPGIEFRDNELWIDGHPKSFYSEGQIGIIATKLAIAMAKKRGHIAICFDGVECFDKKNRAEFLKIAEESGLCVIYTRVGDPESGEIDLKTKLTEGIEHKKSKEN